MEREACCTNNLLNLEDEIPWVTSNLYYSKRDECQAEESNNFCTSEGVKKHQYRRQSEPVVSKTVEVLSPKLMHRNKFALYSEKNDEFESLSYLPKEAVKQTFMHTQSAENSPQIRRCFKNSEQCFIVNLYIETKAFHLGPFLFEIYPKMNVRLLKLKEETEVIRKKCAENYEHLLKMDDLNLVRNVVNFTCPVCFGDFESDQGVVLHECLHTFCIDCLARTIDYAEEVLIKCPFRDDEFSCQSYLQQREIKALVSPEIYERYLQRSIITAESLAEKSFHCKTPDCPSWCMFDENINIFHCPVCFHYNCLNCRTIHEGLNCRQYQDKLQSQKKLDPDSEKTLEFLNKMIEAGKALKCPKCSLILMKKWGCDWLKCAVCLTEICWITKGPRWGPGGQGDTSGGCKCGVNGIKCHPSCTYCH